jgi:hypothetical protein
MNMLGKRQMERFDLDVAALVTTRGLEDCTSPRPIEFRTRNICAGGAFLKTDSPLPIGTAVDIGIQLAFFTGSTEKERKSHVRLSGSIIRVEAGGMAVKFNDNFQISPVLKDA